MATNTDPKQMNFIGIESWDNLRSNAAASPSGVIQVSIEELNKINQDINRKLVNTVLKIMDDYK